MFFQRQQTCPTCRLDVLRAPTPGQQRQQRNQRYYFHFTNFFQKCILISRMFIFLEKASTSTASSATATAATTTTTTTPKHSEYESSVCSVDGC